MTTEHATVPDHAPAAASPQAVVEALRAAGLAPESDPRRLAEYSYDASNYRVVPTAVCFPRTEHEVVRAAEICHRLRVPLIARGGGTSMSGNSIGSGVVLDLSRHMHAVLDVNTQDQTATVQAGAVLTELRAAVLAASDGRLTFAPDPSSQSRACLGGAIGNDACGNHSVRYGRTADHVLALQVVTAEGLRLTATRSGIRPTDPNDRRAAARAAELERDLQGLAARHLAAIRLELGRIPRQVSGYHLRHLLPEEGFDVARALVGSEGTCVLICSATVGLVECAPRTSLLVAGYDDVVAAARDVPVLLRHRPSAVEGVDEVIVETMRRRRGADAVAELPAGRAWLFIEVDEEGEVESGAGEARADALAADLHAAGRVRDIRRVADPAERADLWRVREDGAGLSSQLVHPATGERIDTWPGWEDAAVRPELLADYLVEFRELLDRHDLTGVMYGHFGAGCMHIRIDFDLRSQVGRAVFRAFCTEAAHLVMRYEGSLSGEHGDGRARSELLPIMYSPEMLSAFAEFARIWDPAGILAPGGLTATRPIDADLALAGVPRRDLGLLTAADGRHPVQACIGVGRCRTHSGGVMCPSFRATGDEKDSTRGRARVLQEFVRGERLEPDWSSTEVAESLELCLACKACSSDCPTGVDMATFKSEFLARHYAGRVRPRVHYSLGLLPLWLRLTPHVAGPLNRLLSGPARRVAARLAGLAPGRELPRFASRRALAAEVAAMPAQVVMVPDTPRGGRQHVEGAPIEETGVVAPEVVLFLDSFTKGLRPQVAGAAGRVLGATHRHVACTAAHCCGLTHITTGRRAAARTTLRRTARFLDTIRGAAGAEVPIVVPEPSCAATLRAELPRLVAAGEPGIDGCEAERAARVAARIRSAAAYLGELAAQGCAPTWPGAVPQRIVVQTHCHEYAVFGNRVQRATLRALGVPEVVEATGCCGLAGDFGFTAGHEAVAAAVAEQALAPALRAHPGEVVLTDGFSCATQVAHLSATDPGCGGSLGGMRAGTHLFELLDPRSQAEGGTP